MLTARSRIRQRGAAGGADDAAALDRDLQRAIRFGRGHGRGVAVIHRFEEAAFGGAAFEPGAAPAHDRQVRHVAVDIDPGHEPAAEPETAGGRVVVDLVFGIVRGVERDDLIRIEMSGGGHRFLFRR